MSACGCKPGCNYYHPPDVACGVACKGIKLGMNSLCFFDRVAASHVAQSGTDISFWSQDIENSKRDALYDEVIDREWKGPYNMIGYVSKPTKTTDATESGTKWTWTGDIWVPRTAFEGLRAPAPKEGDVIKFWHDLVFYAQESVGYMCVPGAGMYFDIINVDTDGHLFDTGAFVGFRCDLSRRTTFTPERKLKE